MCSSISSWRFITDIKYTICLTWPRCSYSSLSNTLRSTSLLHSTIRSSLSTPLQPRSSLSPGTVSFLETRHAHTRLPPQLLLPPVMASLLTAEGYVIPHDEAYASANRHHHPTPPSPERLSPPPWAPQCACVAHPRACRRTRLWRGAGSAWALIRNVRAA
jgi:hypothetical protein